MKVHLKKFLAKFIINTKNFSEVIEMFIKKFIKKICAIAAAGVIGLTLTISPVASDLTITNVAEAAQQKMSPAEQDLNDYLSNHSLKELNKTEEGQRLMYNYFCEKKGVSYDPNKNARLRNMMSQLTNAVSKIDPTVHDLPYVYFVNKDTSFNAFCSYAHVMSVNTGAFDLVANDDELAAIVGHEMGHGQKDHVYKGQKSAERKQLIAGIAGIFIGNDIIGNIAGSILLNQSIVHGNKRHEKEADVLAFDYIINTDYNPGACAAVWQRVIEKFETTGEQNAVELFFTPSDHPNHLARRDKYAKRLTEYSGNKVSVKDGMLIINGKNFIIPAATNNMSSIERSYFVLGSLAVAYHKGLNKYDARVENDTVYLGTQPIITTASGDESAQTIADRLNSIK